jgi:ComF family protein
MLEPLRALMRRICPQTCPRCGLEEAEGFCSACQRDFERVAAPCQRCAMPRPCDPCPAIANDWEIDLINAPFVYTPPLSHHLKALKYQGRRDLGLALGRLLATEISVRNLDVDRLVAVPLHPRRLRSRTFNQAHEIARGLGAVFGWPQMPGCLRIVDTPPQTELDQADRHRFARNAFAVRASLAGTRVAIIDDVITTGATVNALARSLRSAGAEQVQAWAVARSIGRGADDSQSRRRM